MTRPGLIDRIWLVGAQAYAQHTHQRFLAAARTAITTQERVLSANLRRNADSDYGRVHHFDQIRGYRDYVRRVPIQRYDDLAAYIDRVKAGDLAALFGGGQRVRMFALTSGSTDRPKYIPVTDAFLKAYRRGWIAWGLKALLDHPGSFLRAILQISSPMDEHRTPAGIPAGAITGLMAATQMRLVRKYYAAPRCTAHIAEPLAKYYTLMRLAIPRDVVFVTAASPATQLKLASTAAEHAERIVRDVRDGTLWDALDVPSAVREELEGGLRPDPACAKRLEGLLDREGALLPRHYWRLGFLANWTGGTMGLYLPKLRSFFGDVPIRDIGLLASEGRMSIPIADGTPAGVCDVQSSFFEFMPADRYAGDRGGVRRAHELDVGAEYFVLLTTSSGLWRYDIGDCVRVTGFLGEAPIFEFLHKGDHVASMSGEKLTERQVVLAVGAAAQHAGAEPGNFIMVPQWADLPFYALYLDAADADRLGEAATLAETVDRELARLNIEYDAKRKSNRLGPLAVRRLPTGYIETRDQQILASRSGRREQFKHQFLYAQPGVDADWPGENADCGMRSAD